MGVVHHGGMAYPWGGGFHFDPDLVDGWQGVASMGGQNKGLIACETTGAPILLRTFFKGSEVTR